MDQLDNSHFLKRFDSKVPIRNYGFEDGSPGLLSAEISGRSTLIKYWLNRDKDKTEILQDIWLYEVRQLHRLKGCPGVGDYISPIYEASYDDHGFYLVLDSNERLPLTVHEQTEKVLKLKKPWIKNTRNIKNRIKLWKNLRRIAKALQILHSQGLLHRHLDSGSVLTDLDSQDPDFQLTGFEWSIRVQRMTETNTPHPQTLSLKHEKCFSFLSDWADYGLMTAKLLQINESALLDLTHPVERIIEDTGITLDEINLIRGLVGCVRLDANIPTEGINASLVIPKIDSLIKGLTSLEVRNPGSLAVSFLFNSSASGKHHRGKTSVFNAVQTVFKEMHGVALNESNTSEFVKFVKDDLDALTYIAIIPAEDDDAEDEVVLTGTRLLYVLNKSKSTIGGTTWDFAFCHSAYVTSPQGLENNKKLIKLDQAITCFSHNDREGMTRFQPTSWEGVLQKAQDSNKRIETDNALTLGFAAYHLAEIAFAKSEIYPTEVISYQVDKDDPSINIVRLKSRKDADAEGISETLNLKAPAVRLKKLISGQGEYSTWMLTPTPTLNDDDYDVELNYLRTTEENGAEIYEFTTTSPDPAYLNNFIIPSSTHGTIRQLSRRASAIDALSEHSELSGMLEAPHFKHMESHESSELHSAYHDLDQSKQEVFTNILKTLPLYLVQGPPGVGKTFLVTALVQQVFSNEPNSRLLLTAQSHATVFHLYKEVKNALDSLDNRQSPPLIVSCIKDSSTEGETDSMAYLDSLARDYLLALSESELFQDSPSETSKSKVIDLAKPGSRSARGSLMNQLLRAANLVFATTNSRQVENLIKSRSQFDWTIMEETGKVTGIELLSPLLLSYRRLMIGDHRQLPPYASEVMRRTLGDIPRLKEALEISLDLLSNSIKGEFIKSVLTSDFLNDLPPEELKKISHEALRLHLLFESLINEEEQAKERSINYFGNSDQHKPIASMLSIQHRMHPDIASLISSVFYGNKLDTAPSKIEYYTKVKKPFYFDVPAHNRATYNDSALLWIDIPDVQANRGFKQGDQTPQWHSALERRVVMKLISKIRKSEEVDRLPQLAILSPYAKQIEKISLSIERQISGLSNLREFSKPNDAISHCSTVDAFQGSEADAVIVSLVRNNSQSYPMGALGFLLDSRRMNVLLSRAKHQLIIVGSFEFLKHWSEKIEREEVKKGNENHKFLVDLISKIENFRDLGLMNFVSYEDLLPDNKNKPKQKAR